MCSSRSRSRHSAAQQQETMERPSVRPHERTNERTRQSTIQPTYHPKRTNDKSICMSNEIDTIRLECFMPSLWNANVSSSKLFTEKYAKMFRKWFLQIHNDVIIFSSLWCANAQCKPTAMPMTTTTMMTNPFEMPLNMQQHVFTWNSIVQIKDRNYSFSTSRFLLCAFSASSLFFFLRQILPILEATIFLHCNSKYSRIFCKQKPIVSTFFRLSFWEIEKVSIKWTHCKMKIAV